MSQQTDRQTFGDLGTSCQQIDETDEVSELLNVSLKSQDLFSSLSRLVHDAGQLVVVLHHVLHHIRLIALQSQAKSFYLDDGIQQIQVL